MNGQYNIWCKWHPLKTVMLGQFYDKSFFENIANKKIKDALVRMAEETHEDLDNYESVLKKFGCNVIRPELSKDLRIENEQYTKGRGIKGCVPRPPLQPRDAQLVIGDKLYFTNRDHPTIKERLLKYNPTHYNLYNGLDDDIRVQDTSARNNWAPNFTVVGKDIYWDLFPCDGKPTDVKFHLLDETLNDFRFNQLNIGGHNDGCFHTIKPGAILSIWGVQTYEDTFPGWDVCYLENESWNKVKGFTDFKKKVNGSWWIPGEEDNDELVHYVQTWLNDWVGYIQESVFDVNVLVLDEHHVCVTSYNKQVWDFLEKHRMTPILVPWRHRFFWDGGLHCITLDLYREGVQEDYFPERKYDVVDTIERKHPRLKIF